MVHEQVTENWWRLTPGAYGDYTNGTWSALAPMPTGDCPEFYASAVLADGRVIVEGGELNCVPGPGDINLGAIFDPTVTPPMGQWTSVPPPTGWQTIGDAPSVVLPADGTFMLGNCCTHFPALYDALLSFPTPTSFLWTHTGSNQAEYNNEHGWTLLSGGNGVSGGTVLVVNTLFGSIDNSQRYFPVYGLWFPAGSTVVNLWDCGGGSVGCEIGPAVLRPDGTVFATGASFTPSRAAHTALYHTAPSDPNVGTWTAGPDFPYDGNGSGLGIADGPAALLPNGNVLLGASVGETRPTYFYEFTLAANYGGGSFVPVPAPPNAVHHGSDQGRLLVLPTGQVLFTDGSTDVEIYTPDDQTYDPAWAPVICGGSCVGTTHLIHFNSTNTISGQQFNGMSQASMYGDDAQMATNYPLVRITADSFCTPKFCYAPRVYYCRTHDHSSMAVATGSLTVTTFFECPPTFPTTGFLEVVANGIPSNQMRVKVGP